MNPSLNTRATSRRDTTCDMSYISRTTIQEKRKGLLLPHSCFFGPNIQTRAWDAKSSFCAGISLKNNLYKYATAPGNETAIKVQPSTNYKLVEWCTIYHVRYGIVNVTRSYLEAFIIL